MTVGIWAGGETVAEEQVQCDRKDCDEWFSKKTHNQRYHNDECCRLATNAKIMQKYYQRRDQRLGKPRTCIKCEVTRLSRYNDSQVCASCDSKQTSDINQSVLDMLLEAKIA